MIFPMTLGVCAEVDLTAVFTHEVMAVCELKHDVYSCKV